MRTGSSLTELRKAAAALAEANQPAEDARRDAWARTANRSAQSAFDVARDEYVQSRVARARRLEEESDGMTIDEKLAADPFEREAYKPLVVLKEELIREAQQAEEEARRGRELEEEKSRKQAEERAMEAELADALAAATSAQEAKRRREQQIQFDETQTAAFGAAPKLLQNGTSSKARRQALLWKRAASAAAQGLATEHVKGVSPVGAAEAAAEAEHERALAAAAAAAKAAEEEQTAEASELVTVERSRAGTGQSSLQRGCTGQTAR